MLVPTYYELIPAFQRAGKEFIILWIFANRFNEWAGDVNFRILHHIFNYRSKIDGWMICGQDFPHPPVFIDNFWSDCKLDFSIVPCFEYLIWWTTEKDTRNEHVGIQDNYHFLPLALIIALEISVRLNPASLACRRAS